MNDWICPVNGVVLTTTPQRVHNIIACYLFCTTDLSLKLVALWCMSVRSS